MAHKVQERSSRGQLIASMNLTADGCCDHRLVVADDELHSYANDVVARSKGLLFGRVTYELFEQYWPDVARPGAGNAAAVEFARQLDEKPKHLVSRTITAVRWRNASVISGDLALNISRLKEQNGDGHLLVFGSPGLTMSLARLGLVDEYHFLIQPLLSGGGPRAFDGLDRVDLQLAESRPFRSGVILNRYVPRSI